MEWPRAWGIVNVGIGKHRATQKFRNTKPEYCDAKNLFANDAIRCKAQSRSNFGSGDQSVVATRGFAGGNHWEEINEIND